MLWVIKRTASLRDGSFKNPKQKFQQMGEKYSKQYSCIDICIAVYTHCQMNGNPCANQEIHMLFEHGFELENT